MGLTTPGAAGVNIIWNIPPLYNPNNPQSNGVVTIMPNLAYTINIYSSQSEDGAYGLLTNISAGPSNSTYTYFDQNGQYQNTWYYVTYVPNGGVEGSPILARIAPTATELRLMTKLYSILPEVIQVRLDPNPTQLRDALQNALSMVNAYAPVTSYDFNTMSPFHSAAVEFGAQMLLYMEQMLQISIRDFSYGVSGISLNVDRGARINTALAKLKTYWNDYLKYVKMADYPDAIGMGSQALAVPNARVFSFLFNGSAGC